MIWRGNRRKLFCIYYFWKGKICYQQINENKNKALGLITTYNTSHYSKSVYSLYNSLKPAGYPGLKSKSYPI